MNPLGSLRRAPWLSGTLSLVLALGLVAPAAYVFGLRRWPLLLGLLAVAVLLLGSLEQAWQNRALARPPRPRSNKKFRVVPGGKGNGHADDLLKDTSTDKQRWLM